MQKSRRMLEILLVCGLAAGPLFSSQRPPAEAEKSAEKVLLQAIIIDTHADTPQMMLDEGYDLNQPDSPFMISVRRCGRGISRPSSSPFGWMWGGRSKISFTARSI